MWSEGYVHVCMWTKWKAQCRCNPGPYVTLRQLRTGPARGSDREGGGGWDLHTLPAFFCKAELVIWTESWMCAQQPSGAWAERQWSSPQAGLTVGERPWTRLDQYVFARSFIRLFLTSPPFPVLPLLFSYCTDPLFCDQLSLPPLPQTVHRLHCFEGIPAETQLVVDLGFKWLLKNMHGTVTGDGWQTWHQYSYREQRKSNVSFYLKTFYFSYPLFWIFVSGRFKERGTGE